MKENQEALKILDFVGGEENVEGLTHCVTRLRFILKDKEKVNQKELEKLNLVKGCFYASGQFQVIIGPGKVERVYQEIISNSNIKESNEREIKEKKTKESNGLQRLIRVLADIFIPILPAIVAAGLLMGLYNVISNPGIFYERPVIEVHKGIKDFADVINMIANTAFTFLPVLVGWSATKRFGGNPVLGIVLGLILVHPNLMNAYEFASDPSKVKTWSILGLEVNQVGYQGQVLPVIIASLILAKLEIFIKKFIPDVVQLIFVAPIALLLTGFITFFIIGPITLLGANGITDGILWLFKQNSFIAGFIYAFIQPPLIITGMHHLFLGVNLQMAGTLGYVTLWPIGETVTTSMGAATITMFILLRKRDKKLSSVSLAATFSAWLGVTEPAIYGINLRFRYPFIAVMLGSALGSGFLSLMKIKATSVGVGGILSFLSVYPEMWAIYFTGQAIAFITTVTLTYIFYKKKLFKAKEEVI